MNDRHSWSVENSKIPDGLFTWGQPIVAGNQVYSPVSQSSWSSIRRTLRNQRPPPTFSLIDNGATPSLSRSCRSRTTKDYRAFPSRSWMRTDHTISGMGRIGRTCEDARSALGKRRKVSQCSDEIAPMRRGRIDRGHEAAELRGVRVTTAARL